MIRRILLVLCCLGSPALADDPPPVTPTDPPGDPTDPSPPTGDEVPAPPAPLAPVPTTPPPAIEPPPSVVEPSPVVGVDERATPAVRTALTRLTVSGEVFAAGTATRTDGDELSAFDVPRAEVGAELGFARRLSAALRVEAVRSATDQSTLGIDGNSLVLRIKRAFVAGGLDVGPVGLSAAAGMIPDPWIATLETGYPLRALAPTASEGLLGWDTGDLGVSLAASYGPARVVIAAGNGEGRRQPELNDGKNLTGVLDVRVLDHRAATVHVLAVARDGSLGPERARDRRFGGGVALRSRYADVGIEIVRALGLLGRGEVEATAAAAWVAAPVVWQLGVVGRYAAVKIDNADTTHTVTGGLSITLIDAAPGTVRGFVAIEWERDRMTLPGTVGADAVRFLAVIAATGTAGLE
jgi:hypothetical protein